MKTKNSKEYFDVILPTNSQIVFYQYYFTDTGTLKGIDSRHNVLTESGPFDSYDPKTRIIKTAEKSIYLPPKKQEQTSFLQASTRKWLKHWQES
jgi:hypothetical protein